MSLPCLIAGAGPTGLTLALLLAKYGVPSRILERASAVSTHPQAHFINNRTMEIFRHLDGLSDEIRAMSPPLDEWRRFIYCRSMADQGSAIGQVDHFPAGQKEALNPLISPEPVSHLPQNQLLPLLHRRIQKYQKEGLIDLLMDHTVTSVSESEEGVLVNVRGPGHKRQEIIMHGSYLAAADGANSAIRKQMGIEMIGDKIPMQHLINVHFTSSEMGRLAASWPAMIYFIFNEKVVAVIVAHSIAKGEFVAQIPFFPPLQSAEDFDAKRCLEIIQAASGLGSSSLGDLSIKQVRPWIMDSKVASSFASDSLRVFLLGDAAHRFPPAGGFGMNTGIQDSHNLAWKLALSHTSDKHDRFLSLLKTYEEERRPIAIANADLSVRNWQSALRVPQALGLDPRTGHLVSLVASQCPLPASASKALLEGAFGVGRWLSSASLPWIEGNRRDELRRIFEGQQTLRLQFPQEDLGFSYGPPKDQPNRHGTSNDESFCPSSAPGHRLPHCWLMEAGNRISTIDISAGSTYPTLIVSHHDIAWIDAALLVAGRVKEMLHICWIKDVMEETDRQISPRVRVLSELERDSFQGTMFGDSSDRRAGSVLLLLVRPDGHVAWRGTGSDLATMDIEKRESILHIAISNLFR